MIINRRSKSKKYKLQDGDTLEKIAEREGAKDFPLTGAVLAKFNWGTDDADVVDEFLRDELGCYKRGDDNHFVISADAEPRSDLFIPEPFKEAGLATDRTHVIRLNAVKAPPDQFHACAMVRGVCFEFNKSFIRPTVVDDLEVLNKLVKKHPDARIIIFGHTDKVGTEQYNKDLSERRALSTYAFITNDVDTWEKLYNEENWGIGAVQAILDDLEGDFNPGPVNGKDGPETQAAVRKYQEARGLKVDGIAGPKTREQLFTDYMTSKHDIKIEPDQFLEPKHVGCSEFDPVVETDEACEANRRVTFFFFNKDRPPNIPCKKGQVTPCKKQAKAPLPRHTATFHCSFYDSIARDCLAESGTGTVTLTDPPWLDIDSLDKWFLPGLAGEGGETCVIKYALTGRKELSDKVVLEVHASNYCSSKVNNDGKLEFTKLTGTVPVYTRELAPEFARTGEMHEITDWTGESNATDGALKAPEGQKRFLNAAFSPYTVHLRYLEKGATDTEGRILLNDFWPRWEKKDGDDTLVPESLKISWIIEKTEKLKKGKLLILDNEEAVAFERDLSADDLKKGEFSWDGKTLEGGDAKPEQMPYRVQIQACTGEEEPAGMAIAAMHTEVRLFVDPATHLAAEKDYDPAGDPQAFDVKLAPLVPQANPPEKTQGTRWCQYQLARSGFHPGPVDGTDRDEYKLALKEFQRSVPKRKAAAADDYQRLTPDGNENNDTRNALEDLPASPLRPWFGDAASRADLSNADADAVLCQKEKDLIVWVDDRHGYTESAEAEISGHVSYMANYRGSMEVGDGRAAKDEASIARPWLALQAGPLVLGKSAGLDSADRPAESDAARKAVGPIRIDWAFDEIGPDVSVIDTAAYNKDRTRSLRYAEWVLDEQKKTYKRKDIVRDAVYTNCPKEFGGFRPEEAKLKDYYGKVFGTGDKNLQPWRAVADGDVETVATIVHDDLGQGPDALFEPLIGRAGVYFNPGNIAGDGYRVQARARFRKCDGYDFPNLDVLARRYPRLPQAHTAKMRIWRKSSLRAYIRWAPASTGHWDAFMTKFRSLYAAAHVHFIFEPGPNAAPPGNATEYNLVDVLNPAVAADRTTFSNIIKDRVRRTYHKNNPNHARLDPNYNFPWYHLAHFDYIWPAPANTLFNKLYDDYYGTIFDDTWRAYRDRLLNEILRRVEAKHGMFRGHLLVEFRSTPRYWVEEYRCDGCHNRYWWIEIAAAGGSAAGKSCTDCSGHMQRQTPANVKASTSSSFPLPAVGTPLSATWLFTSSSEETWTHEVGHHRQLEHAASAPVGGRAPARVKLHDTEENTHEAWNAGVAALDKQWDRCCIMSYTSDAERLYFCGKCILRNRGWKVEDLGVPGTDEHDP